MATPGQGPDRPQEVSYTDTKVIGNGSFGVVYQAKLCDSGELVAIKKVLQDKRFKVEPVLNTCIHQHKASFSILNYQLSHEAGQAWCVNYEKANKLKMFSFSLPLFFFCKLQPAQRFPTARKELSNHEWDVKEVIFHTNRDQRSCKTRENKGQSSNNVCVMCIFLHGVCVVVVRTFFFFFFLSQSGKQ